MTLSVKLGLTSLLIFNSSFLAACVGILSEYEQQHLLTDGGYNAPPVGNLSIDSGNDDQSPGSSKHVMTRLSWDETSVGPNPNSFQTIQVQAPENTMSLTVIALSGSPSIGVFTQSIVGSLLLCSACSELDFPLSMKSTSFAETVDQPGGEPQPVAISSKSSLRSRILALFGGREQGPHKNALLGIAPVEPLVATLHEIYHDHSIPLFKRLRAVASLRHFPTAASRQILEETLRSPDTSVFVRRVVVKGYGSAFGVQAIDVLEELAGDPDLHTRDAVARALGKINTPRARAILLARMKSELDGVVQSTLHHQIAKNLPPTF